MKAFYSEIYQVSYLSNTLCYKLSLHSFMVNLGKQVIEICGPKLDDIELKLNFQADFISSPDSNPYLGDDASNFSYILCGLLQEPNEISRGALNTVKSYANEYFKALVQW